MTTLVSTITEGRIGQRERSVIGLPGVAGSCRAIRTVRPAVSIQSSSSEDARWWIDRNAAKGPPFHPTGECGKAACTGPSDVHWRDPGRPAPFGHHAVPIGSHGRRRLDRINKNAPASGSDRRSCRCARCDPANRIAARMADRRRSGDPGGWPRERPTGPTFGLVDATAW